MVDAPHLAKVLKDAMKSGKYSIGAKDSIAGMKGAKALLCTRSIPPALDAKLREEAKKHGVQVIDLPLTSAQFARMVGRPYSVSALALRSVSEADLKQLLR